jgi:serine/threonine-protein kinase
VDVLQPGATLGGRYVLREPVARGGMGEVWRAEDPVLRRTVAAKVLLPGLSGDPDFAVRFQTEARAMAALSDPGIVEVYDFGQVDGVSFLVMPFVDGESLHHLLNRVGPLSPHDTMSVVAQAANALEVAHRSGIVHRDVKPANLLVRPDGRVVLTDFGIARAVAADQVTAGGGLVGTAAYLAPEQVAGGRVAPTTDVYALGIVAYECLTLTRPFVADSPVGVALMHTRDEPPPLPDTVPPGVRRVVMRALVKDPDERWPSAQAMAEAATEAARDLPDLSLAAAPRPAAELTVAPATTRELALAQLPSVGRGGVAARDARGCVAGNAAAVTDSGSSPRFAGGTAPVVTRPAPTATPAADRVRPTPTNPLVGGAPRDRGGNRHHPRRDGRHPQVVPTHPRCPGSAGQCRPERWGTGHSTAD